MLAVAFDRETDAVSGRVRQEGTVPELLLENPRRIEQGEPGNLAFGVHRSIDNPNEFGCMRPGRPGKRWKRTRAARRFSGTSRRCARWSTRAALLFGNCVPVKVLGYSTDPPAAASAPPRES
jgi:hypothetical protein